jgi:(p)ppGpp synthase/HD superfamily hydrolase
MQDTKTLLADIKRQFGEVYESVSEVEKTMHNLTSENEYEDEEHELALAILVSRLKQLFISLCMALERLGFIHVLGQLQKEFQRTEAHLAELVFLPYVGVWHSEA